MADISVEELDALMEQPITKVSIEGLVVMSILEHCQNALPDKVTGNLLGLDIGGVVEVTSSFPMPNPLDDDAPEDTRDYQLEMMEGLGNVNVDNNLVGWYTTSYVESFVKDGVVNQHYNFQSSIPNSVVIVFDPLKTIHGSLSIKALRLTDSFMALYKRRDFSMKAMLQNNVSYRDIFEEVPIEVTNLALLAATMYDLSSHPSMLPDYQNMDLASSKFLSKNLESLLDSASDLQGENREVMHYTRNLQRQQVAFQQFLARRKAENEKRQQAGQPLLPETIEAARQENPGMFRPLSEPPRLSSTLISYHIDEYCSAILTYSAASLTKQYIVKGLKDE